MTTSQLSRWSTRGVDQRTLDATLTPAVAAGLEQVRRAFADQPVHAWPSEGGGVMVVIDDLDLGPIWAQETTWLAFQISYLHPDADCYPHWVRPDLQRADGAAITPPIHNQNQTFDGQPAIMISRRSNARDPHIDTPARKAHSVLHYLREPT
jgi:hypothetical protein